VLVVEPDGRARWRGPDGVQARYRRTDLDGCVVLAADLELRPGCPERLRERRLELVRRKAAVQPVEARSAGCVFKNPAGGSAGRLIDELGLKGLRRGGAVVSPLHGNFIVNEGGATPEDVLALVEDVRGRVRAACGVELLTEVRLIGLEQVGRQPRVA
jgi:UDP-N-acetylmuramate dehydrogenase